MDMNNTQEQSGYVYSFHFQNFLISSSVWNRDPGCTLQQGSWLGAGWVLACAVSTSTVFRETAACSQPD